MHAIAPLSTSAGYDVGTETQLGRAAVAMTAPLLLLFALTGDPELLVELVWWLERCQADARA